MLGLVNHNYDAFLNRILGARSPIIDVEHLQLFCPGSLWHLLCAAGYDVVASTSFPNTYPLRYWLRLLPLPAGAKRILLQMASIGARRANQAIDQCGQHSNRRHPKA